MQGIVKRGKIYWLSYNINGVRHRESSKSTDKQYAKNLLDLRIAESREGIVGRAVSTTTIDDLIPLIEADYHRNKRKTVRDMLWSITRMRDAFKGQPVIAISYDKLEAYIARREKDGASPRTIQKELTIFGRACKLGVRAKKLSVVPPLPTITLDNARQGFFEVDEFNAVLHHLPAWCAAIIQAAYITGWRIGELRGLQWKDINFTTGEMRLEPGTTKNKDGRVFPFSASPRLAAILQERRKWADEFAHDNATIPQYVFANRAGRQIIEYKWPWKQACKKAGLPGKLVHDFRRTAVRNLVAAGVDRHVAKKITGHRSDMVFERYHIVTDRDVREAVGKVAGTQ